MMPTKKLNCKQKCQLFVYKILFEEPKRKQKKKKLGLLLKNLTQQNWPQAKSHNESHYCCWSLLWWSLISGSKNYKQKSSIFKAFIAFIWVAPGRPQYICSHPLPPPSNIPNSSTMLIPYIPTRRRRILREKRGAWQYFFYIKNWKINSRNN